MAGDSKTEKATPKKRRDERKKGNVFVSQDLITVVSLLGSFFVLKVLFPRSYTAMKQFLLEMMNFAATKEEISMEFSKEIMVAFCQAFLSIAVPVILASLLISLGITVAQTKMLFSIDSLKPKFSRINPIQGIMRLFSVKSFVEVIKGVLKIVVLLAIIYQYFQGQLLGFTKTLSMGILPSCGFLLRTSMGLVFRIGIAFAAVSVLDYFFQWWDYERQIKMSKQEVKEEFKQMEGDPQVKGKIKENQRRMAMSRMMQAVPTADVVVKNPTHFAVALRYDKEKDAAPVVVAKGQDELALRIIKVAEETEVSVIENVPLARALYATTELNREIPAEFYGTVAELLVYVYKLNHKKIL